MNQQNAYQKYKKVQAETANPGKLLLMLYQGCIKFLRLAKLSIENENIEDANNYIIRSQNIINELMNTLDMEKGGQIAENLYNLYEFMNSQLLEANIKKELEPVQVVENLMIELLDAFNQIINGQSEEKEEENTEQHKITVNG